MSNGLFEYDVAVSFTHEDRAPAEELARLLRDRDIAVLPDEYSAATLGGSDFVTHIAEIFRTQARYCVLLISRHYPLKRWTHQERTAAREHALRDADEYILPVQLDDSDVPGITETAGFRDLRQHSMESIADLLAQKLRQTRDQSGPPPQSHDLRSGNVPGNDQKP